MNNMSGQLFKLVKSGYYCKKNIRKCLKKDKSSQSYFLAAYYDQLIKEFQDNEELTLERIDTIVNQLNAHRVEYQEIEEVQQLLSNILPFFETVKPFLEEKLA